MNQIDDFEATKYRHTHKMIFVSYGKGNQGGRRAFFC